MNILLLNDILDKFQLKNSEYLIDSRFYSEKSGTQEYRLYSYLTTFFNDSIILDIGTFDGRSALALSHNERNKVISYDIVDGINNKDYKIYNKPNIEFKIKNVLDDLNEELIKKVKIVMIDIDHYGTIELEIINRLYYLGFSGIILVDDVFHHPHQTINQKMAQLWADINPNLKKYDVTRYGHWSGTGIILMNTDITFTFF